MDGFISFQKLKNRVALPKTQTGFHAQSANYANVSTVFIGSRVIRRRFETVVT